MKKSLIIVSIAILLALDWAALDDITTGKEPTHWQEWTIVVVSIPLLALCGKKLLTSHARG